MTNDPIVDEVHRVREKLLAECDGDLDKLMNRLGKRESEERSPVVKSVHELKGRTGRARRPVTRWAAVQS